MLNNESLHAGVYLPKQIHRNFVDDVRSTDLSVRHIFRETVM